MSEAPGEADGEGESAGGEAIGDEPARPGGTRRRSRAAELADRLVCVAALAFGVGAASLAWWAWVRVDAWPSSAYGALVALLGSLSALGISFPAWRHRLYAQIPAPRLLLIGVALSGPLLLVEVTANLVDLRGYLYFAQSQRYFAGQRYDVLPDHAHPPGYTLRYPWGAITTNAEGWRGPALDEAKPAETLRVLGLGDSVLFSWGVDDADTVARQLEARLGEALPAGGAHRAVQVINTGNGSFSSLDELLTLRSRGLAYDPDVVFVIVIGNDFYDRPPWEDQVDWLAAAGLHDPRTLEALRAQQAPRPRPAGPQGWLRGPFLTISYLVNRSFVVVSAAQAYEGWARYRAQQASAAPPAASPTGSPSPGTNPSPTVTPSPGASPSPRVSPSPGTGSPTGTTSPPPAEDLSAAFPYLRAQVAALREIAATCRAEGLPLVVFTFTGNLTSPQLADHLERELDGETVVRLRYPEDPRAVMNSATDLHWNPDGIGHFVAQMLPALRQAAGWPPAGAE